MLHELRTYTFRAGQAALAARNSGTVARDIRADDYGKLEGYWLPEVGTLNQVMHLWSYESYAEREEKRRALAANERWSSEYLPLIRPIILRQDIRLMTPIIDLKPPVGANTNLYEFRHYRLKVGAAKKWIERFTKALPARERHSKIVALWLTEAGQPNEVCHLWAYPSFEARMQARDAASQDPDWQAYLQESLPEIEQMNNLLMMPSDHSPLR